MTLAISLILTVLLLMFALSYLYFVENDYRFAATQERGQESFYLALSGLQYAAMRPDLVPAGGAVVVRMVPPDSQTHRFEVQRRPDGTLVATGIIQFSNGRMHNRTLEVAAGRPILEYRDLSL